MKRTNLSAAACADVKCPEQTLDWFSYYDIRATCQCPVVWPVEACVALSNVLSLSFTAPGPAPTRQRKQLNNIPLAWRMPAVENPCTTRSGSGAETAQNDKRSKLIGYCEVWCAF